jgi:methylated-DNA-[protein]-cysteine S-methyltransferase
MISDAKQETKLTVYVPSDLGWIVVVGSEQGIELVDFTTEEPPQELQLASRSERDDAVVRCAEQIREYLDGQRVTFDVPLRPSGTTFQQSVWSELQTIPCGETKSYGDIARSIGNPKGVRAVGGAIGRNPISIIVPCHRVIGSNGSLTGYAGELWRKEWLLAHEKSLNGK